MCKPKIRRGKDFKKGQIRFNFKHNHYAHLKKIEVDGMTSVFISSKEKDCNKPNEPIDSIIFKDGAQCYFIKRVRKYPKNTYSTDYVVCGLCFKDRIKSRKIYKNHLRNKKDD